MTWVVIRLLSVAAVCAMAACRNAELGAADAGAPRVRAAAQAISLRYVANAGVLLSIDEVRLLIDAPIRQGIPPYATSSAAEREQLERALPPYDRIEAILVTHWHEDHFSADAVAAHLTRNPRAVLISSPEVVDRVRAVDRSLDARLRPLLPQPGEASLTQVASTPVRVLRIRHNPARRFPEQHVGFLIGDRSAVLHTGDADPSPDNFAVLRDLPPVDLALVPFWFMQGGSRREFVRTSIAPRRVAAMHLPPEDAEAVGRDLRSLSTPFVLLTTPGSIVRLP